MLQTAQSSKIINPLQYTYDQNHIWSRTWPQDIPSFGKHSLMNTQMKSMIYFATVMEQSNRCFKEISNSGNSLVDSEMGNPWSIYVPLSSSHPQWFRTVTHRLTGFRALSGAHQLRPNIGWNMRLCSEIFGFLSGIQIRIRYILLMPSPTETPSSLQLASVLASDSSTRTEVSSSSRSKLESALHPKHTGRHLRNSGGDRLKCNRFLGATSVHSRQSLVIPNLCLLLSTSARPCHSWCWRSWRTVCRFHWDRFHRQ